MRGRKGPRIFLFGARVEKAFFQGGLNKSPQVPMISGYAIACIHVSSDGDIQYAAKAGDFTFADGRRL